MRHNLILPPAFELFTLREGKRAHEEAISRAHAVGAGALFWVRRFDVAEFALVLEPEAPLKQARTSFFLGMNALADTLSSLARAERPVHFKYPDCLFFDYGLIGGGRLAWPEIEEENIPEWLVFSAQIRLNFVGSDEEGNYADVVALEDANGETVEAGLIVETFAKHFMHGVHLFEKEGFKKIAQNYLSRLEREGDEKSLFGLDINGDLLKSKAASTPFLTSLTSKWYDAKNGLPKIG